MSKVEGQSRFLSDAQQVEGRGKWSRAPKLSNRPLARFSKLEPMSPSFDADIHVMCFQFLKGSACVEGFI